LSYLIFSLSHQCKPSATSSSDPAFKSYSVLPHQVIESTIHRACAVWWSSMTHSDLLKSSLSSLHELWASLIAFLTPSIELSSSPYSHLSTGDPIALILFNLICSPSNEVMFMISSISRVKLIIFSKSFLRWCYTL